MAATDVRDAGEVWGEYPDHDGGIALLRHVVDSGVTFVDTADVYGPHSNEELIREACTRIPAIWCSFGQ